LSLVRIAKDKINKFLFILALSVLLWFIPIAGLDIQGRVTLIIFVSAAFFWTTEIIPLYVTSLFVLLSTSVLLPYFLEGVKYTQFYSAFFSPILVLFLGGFAISLAMQKYKLDGVIASQAMRFVRGNPYYLIIVFMLITAFLSMWISNTAAAALMIGMGITTVSKITDAKFKTFLFLAIAFAANIGGMATPIGSPPNAIALGLLANMGITVGFLEWMLYAVPFALLLLIVVFVVLYFTQKFTTTKITEITFDKVRLGQDEAIIIFTAVITVVLWFLSEFIGISANIIALIPLISFFGSKVLTHTDFKTLDWDILFLIGGGLALSQAVTVSGLSTWFMGVSHLDALPALVVLVIFVLLAFVLTNFISNTTTAALLLPLALLVFDNSLLMAFAIAFTASLSMLLPVSTPPNAIAYGTGVVSSQDMLKSGFIISVTSLIFLGLFLYFFIGF
jgi:solute carrier family 13 (sodium-dependent dicarboxylate transporter), member 2/3/5